jgi:hypothetical protein
MIDKQRYAKKYAEQKRIGAIPMPENLKERIEQLKQHGRPVHFHSGTNALNCEYDVEALQGIGQKVSEGGVRGNVGTYGTAEEKQRRWKAYQVFRDAGHSIKETADHFKMNVRTIQRRTKKTK